MPVDPLDAIMAYLGLQPTPLDYSSERPRATAARASSEAVGPDPERCLKTIGAISLWMAGNEDAEWVEVRGPFATVRATRRKAQLLVTVRIDIERWADGALPDVKTHDLTITTVRRFGTLNLEIRHRTWKPLRLSREQARATLRFFDQISAFAKG